MNVTADLACATLAWQRVTTQPNQLGESPFWHPLEHRLYWIDIPARQVLRTDVATGIVETWDLPSEPGCIAPAASGGLVLALRHGVFRARQWGGPLQQIATLGYDPAFMRANDGKCDALGRFWIGTIDETKSAHNAALYCLDCRNGRAPLLERKVGHAITANGLAWSPDGRTLYWSDTPSHTVQAWAFDAPLAALSAERTFHQFAARSASLPATTYGGRPDGAAVDAEGNYFVALYEGRRVCQLAPDGTLLAQWQTPVQCPTMVCFGGDDLRTLYLTSARQKRSTEELKALPLSGCIFSMRVKVPGLPVNFFAD
ncbi:MAG: SMP-30/gluconolactonase/LRE family protein [Burkholderiales bacterium]|nr:SMP-30/gluconolactonase/LRE family protein [Burkholderiales bacterium]